MLDDADPETPLLKLRNNCLENSGLPDGRGTHEPDDVMVASYGPHSTGNVGDVYDFRHTGPVGISGDSPE